MKKKLFLFTLLFLSGCEGLPSIGSSASSSDTPISSGSFSSASVVTSSDRNVSLSSSSDSFSTVSSAVEYGTRSVRLFGINDFHGAVLPNGYEPGIVRLGGYLKAMKDEGNTLLLNSGDLWQGAIESNYNRGNLLTDCMNEIGFDCFTLGNHEFDWGDSYIRSNRERKAKDSDYQTPFLAANIYNYDLPTKTVGSYADLGEKYTIRTLQNGLRVGIIGVIGKDQITSITSQYVDHLTFLNPTPIIKELSDELRTERAVDVVVVDCHTDQRSITESTSSGTDNAGITATSAVSGKRYVDAVFCAHTHKTETDFINGVPFIQTSGYGKTLSQVNLSVGSSGEVRCEKYLNSYTSTIDASYDSPALSSIVESYKEESDRAGQEVLGTLSGDLTSSSTLVNFVAAAIAEYASSCRIPIDYAISNTGRYDLASGEVTYAELYRSLPFDNEIYILEAKGSDIRNELRYDSNGMYRVDKDALKSNETYTVAVLDYLALHRNSNREYNYFPSMKIISKLTKEDYDIFNYRDLTADYIRGFNGRTIDTSLYSSAEPHHDTSKLTQQVSF